MYEIYTQTRPGRPRWALAACAFLLLLTILLAVWVSYSKVHGTPVALEGESRLLPAGRLRIRLPADWDRTPSRLSTLPGIVAEARRQESGIGEPAAPEEVVIVFRGIPRPHGIPSIDAAESIRQVLGIIEPLVEQRSEPAAMGSLPGWTIEFAPDTRSRSRLHYLGRACLAPDGQIAGILLTTFRPPTQEDLRLVDNMSASLELADLKTSDDPKALLKQAGMSFPPPPGARFFTSIRDKPLPMPRLRLAGGTGRQCWYLDATRVPLIGGRATADLVQQHALTLLEQTELPKPLQTAKIQNRPVAWLTLTLPAKTSPSLLLWGADIDENTGLLLVGRYEPDGEKALRSAAEAITAGIIEPYTSVVDIELAQATARRWLAEIAAEGLAARWTGRTSQTAQTRSPGIALRNTMRTYEVKAAKDGFKWWEINVTALPPRTAGRSTAESQEKWSVRDDAASHEELYQERGFHEAAINYKELRTPGQDQVLCELTLGDNEPVSWKVAVDDTYACEPVLLAAGAKVARDPQGRPAVFSATESFCSKAVYWIMVPLGDRALPEEQDGKTARAVCLVRDFDPWPIVFYYDETGDVVATSFDGVFWQQRVETNKDTEPKPRPQRRPR